MLVNSYFKNFQNSRYDHDTQPDILYRILDYFKVIVFVFHNDYLNL